jgi:antitoxin component YwqK of YwqJK toxin-antitoxin module
MFKFFLFIVFYFTICVNALSQKSVEKSYYSNGKVSAIIQTIKGIREGRAKWFYENGQLQVTGIFKNGKEHGLWRGYHFNGKRAHRSQLDYGIQNGYYKLYNKLGKLEKIDYYRKGVLIKSIKFNHNMIN